MEEEEEPLDPRVQMELERLNASSDEINKLENKLEEANGLFRSTLSDSTASLKLLAGRIGAAVGKARPYYEAREAARKTQVECQRAAVQFQRASVLHQNARETIQLAEERFLPGGARPGPFSFDSAWQEMLNHATMKLLEAERLKTSSEREHLRRAQNFADAQTKLKRLERALDKSIGRARPYFEQREVVQQELGRQKAAVQQLQKTVSSAKARYSASLRELENISEQIHEQRRLRELEPDLVPVDLDTCDLGSVSGVTESATSDYEEDFRLSQEQQYWTEMREQIEALSAAMPQSDASVDAMSSLSLQDTTHSTVTSPPSHQADHDAETTATDEGHAATDGDRDEVDAEVAEEPPLAEELSAARLIARRRRTCSEAATGGVPACSGGQEGAMKRLSLPGLQPHQGTKHTEDGRGGTGTMGGEEIGGEYAVTEDQASDELSSTSESATSLETVASPVMTTSFQNVALGRAEGSTASVEGERPSDTVSSSTGDEGAPKAKTASLPVSSRVKEKPDLSEGPVAIHGDGSAPTSSDIILSIENAASDSGDSQVTSVGSLVQADRSISEEEVPLQVSAVDLL